MAPLQHASRFPPRASSAKLIQAARALVLTRSAADEDGSEKQPWVIGVAVFAVAVAVAVLVFAARYWLNRNARRAHEEEEEDDGHSVGKKQRGRRGR